MFVKFSCVVSIYLPLSWSLSEKAIACTKKSMPPHSLFNLSNKLSTLLGSLTSQSTKIFDPNC